MKIFRLKEMYLKISIMALNYSYLAEVFPDYPRQQYTCIPIAQEDPPNYSNQTGKILDLQPGQRLRIVNNKLEIDTRKFQSIYRKYTGDSRWKILEKILQINNANVREFYLDILRTSTYSKDSKWIEASRKNLKK